MAIARQQLTSGINVTPFLDVLLVLIITFLAATSARKILHVARDLCRKAEQGAAGRRAP